MANQEYINILTQGVDTWNEWRIKNPEVYPDLSRAELEGVNLSGANLSNINLTNANLVNSDLRYAKLNYSNLTHAVLKDARLNNANLSAAGLEADFSNADLKHADLSHADLNAAKLFYANLSYANLRHASLRRTNLRHANLSFANLFCADLMTAHFSHTNLNNADLTGASLFRARLIDANLRGANLNGADLSEAEMAGTILGGNDLSVVKGLDTVRHFGPSTIGIDTLFMSGGKIPIPFLQGCGIPENFSVFLHSHIGAEQAIQFYSCFISYSHKDEEFAKRLHSKMRSENLRVWYAPEDIKGGEKLHEQIDRAIQIHDRLLLVLSENSLKSEWVMTEIRKARKTEISEKRRKLFPIRLVSMDIINAWECFDADSGKDLGVEVREYYIPDFSEWKSHNAFESAFKRLLNDLRAAESKN